MPTETITVIDNEFSVGTTPRTVYGFYSVPSNPANLLELARIKKNGNVPRIVRVRVRYRVEYVRPTPLTTGGFIIHKMDCHGNQVMITEPTNLQRLTRDLPWNNNVDEGEIDVSDLFNCTAPALGINAIKVELFPALTGVNIPIPTTVYRVKIITIWEWGW